MDRKLCVLVYSQFSQASKRLMEYVENLPFDLFRLTGMTLLQADSDHVRRMLKEKEIDSVPTLIVQYFDGKMMILKEDEINKFISAVSANFGSPATRHSQYQIASEQEIDSVEQKPQGVRPTVMELAMEMKNSREEPQKRTPLGENFRNAVE